MNSFSPTDVCTRSVTHLMLVASEPVRSCRWFGLFSDGYVLFMLAGGSNSGRGAATQ